MLPWDPAVLLLWALAPVPAHLHAGSPMAVGLGCCRGQGQGGEQSLGAAQGAFRCLWVWGALWGTCSGAAQFWLLSPLLKASSQGGFKALGSLGLFSCLEQW